MIETFLKTIVNELGPIGLLILGLYWILGQHLRRICKSIETINHNSTKLLEKFDTSVDRICDRLNGKN